MTFGKPTKLIISLAALILGGCVSTNPENHAINETGLMAAKVGFCESPFTDEQITQYIGNDPQDSPEERLTKKSEALDEWKQTRHNAEKWFDSDDFTASHFIQFLSDEDAVDGMLPLNLSYVTNVKGRYLSSIPQEIKFTHSGNRDYAVYYPKSAISGTGNVEGDNRKIKQFILRHYRDTLPEGKSRFFINQVKDEGYGKVNINYNGSFANADENALGVTLPIPRWYNEATSPIVKKGERYYLDISKIDFNEIFDAYPDAYSPRIMVNYVYTLDHCIDGELFGKVKRIELWPVKYGRSYPSGKPLTQFIYQ